MNAPGDSAAPAGLRGWLANRRRGPACSAGSRPAEYRHLRTWAGIRITAGVVTTGLGPS